VPSVLLILAFLAACADPYADAERLNTVEAWEAYLASDAASGSKKGLAETKLAVLVAEQARKDNTVAAFDAYLKRWPKGPAAEELTKARGDAAFLDAEKAGTAEAWKAFLAENPEAEGALRQKASGFAEVATYGGVKVEDVRVEQVNLAGDPKGPKNGWEVRAKVTNTGDKTLKWLNLTASYMGASGNRMSTKSYPVVATTGPGGMPIEEVYQKPLKPGESRSWAYATEDVPEGWTQKASVVASGLRFEE
jgi:hypothetical protein